MTATAQTSLKVSPRTLSRAEKLRNHVAEESGINATRADVLRRALAIGLAKLERELRASLATPPSAKKTR